MKNKLILLIVLIFLFALTGCTAEYNIEIYNETVKEEFSFVEENTSLINSIYEDSTFEDGPYTYKYIVDVDLKTKTPAIVGSEDAIYNKKLIDKNGYGLKYSYDYDLKKYSNGFMGNAAFKYFKFIVEKDKIVLSTSNGLQSFDEYKYLDSLSIHIKTNHVVNSTNADRIDNNDYYWDFNKSNYKDKSVYLELDRTKTVSNYNNSYGKIVIISLIVAFFIISIIIILRSKARRTFDF